jgi:hypothetical protein
MRALNRAILICTTISLASVLVFGQEKQGPDLKATVEFMNRMVEPEHRIISMANQCEIEIVNNWAYSFMFPGGTRQKADEHGIPRWEFTWIVLKEQYQLERFPLHDVDPTSIRSSPAFSSDFLKAHHPVQPSDLEHPDLRFVQFDTTDLKKSVEFGAFKDAGRGDKTEVFDASGVTTSWFAVFESTDRAERFVTALVRATNLCGGKPSDFPPTPGTPIPNPEKK